MEVRRLLSIWQFDCFADPDETNLKRECLITVEYVTGLWVRRLSKKIARLTTFTTKVVVFALEQFEWRKGKEVTGIFKLAIQMRISANWRVLKDEIETVLGSANLISGTGIGKQRLVLQPRKYGSSPMRKQEDAES